MFSLFKPVRRSTAVEFAVEARFVGDGAQPRRDHDGQPDRAASDAGLLPDLIVARTDSLCAYRISEAEATAAAMQGAQDALVLIQRWDLHGTVRGLHRVEYNVARELRASEYDAHARQLPEPGLDMLLLVFDLGKASLVAYDPSCPAVLRTVAIFNFEESAEFTELKAHRAGVIRSAAMQSFNPISAVDPQFRCFAMLVYGAYLAVVPLRRRTRPKRVHAVAGATDAAEAFAAGTEEDQDALDDELLDAEEDDEREQEKRSAATEAALAKARQLAKGKAIGTTGTGPSKKRVKQAQTELEEALLKEAEAEELREAGRIAPRGDFLECGGNSPVVDRPYLLPVHRLGVRVGPVRDLAFLEGYASPTIAILHNDSSIQPWAPRLHMARYTFAVTATALPLAQPLAPAQVWSAACLPHDSQRLVPVPRPARSVLGSPGGVLVVSANALVYVGNTPNARWTMALNGFAPLSAWASTVHPLHDVRGRAVANAKYVDGLPPPLVAPVPVTLEAVRWSWLSHSVLMLAMAEGETISVRLDWEGDLSAPRLSATFSGHAAHPSALCSLRGGRFLFVGSRVGNSLLLRRVGVARKLRREGHSQHLRTVGVAMAVDSANDDDGDANRRDTDAMSQGGAAVDAADLGTGHGGEEGGSDEEFDDDIVEEDEDEEDEDEEDGAQTADALVSSTDHIYPQGDAEVAADAYLQDRDDVPMVRRHATRKGMRRRRHTSAATVPGTEDYDSGDEQEYELYADRRLYQQRRPAGQFGVPAADAMSADDARRTRFEVVDYLPNIGPITDLKLSHAAFSTPLPPSPDDLEAERRAREANDRAKALMAKGLYTQAAKEQQAAKEEQADYEKNRLKKSLPRDEEFLVCAGRSLSEGGVALVQRSLRYDVCAEFEASDVCGVWACSWWRSATEKVDGLIVSGAQRTRVLVRRGADELSELLTPSEHPFISDAPTLFMSALGEENESVVQVTPRTIVLVHGETGKRSTVAFPGGGVPLASCSACGSFVFFLFVDGTFGILKIQGGTENSDASPADPEFIVSRARLASLDGSEDGLQHSHVTASASAVLEVDVAGGASIAKDCVVAAGCVFERRLLAGQDDDGGAESALALCRGGTSGSGAGLVQILALPSFEVLFTSQAPLALCPLALNAAAVAGTGAAVGMNTSSSVAAGDAKHMAGILAGTRIVEMRIAAVGEAGQRLSSCAVCLCAALSDGDLLVYRQRPLSQGMGWDRQPCCVVRGMRDRTGAMYRVFAQPTPDTAGDEFRFPIMHTFSNIGGWSGVFFAGHRPVFVVGRNCDIGILPLGSSVLSPIPTPIVPGGEGQLGGAVSDAALTGLPNQTDARRARGAVQGFCAGGGGIRAGEEWGSGFTYFVRGARQHDAADRGEVRLCNVSDLWASDLTDGRPESAVSRELSGAEGVYATKFRVGTMYNALQAVYIEDASKGDLAVAKADSPFLPVYAVVGTSQVRAERRTEAQASEAAADPLFGGRPEVLMTQHSVFLVRGNDLRTPTFQYDLKPGERAMCVAEVKMDVSLPTKGKFKYANFVVVGTGMLSDAGEDELCSSRLLLFQVQHTPENDAAKVENYRAHGWPPTVPTMVLVAQLDSPARGPVAAVSSVDGMIVAAIGNMQCEIRLYELDDNMRLRGRGLQVIPSAIIATSISVLVTVFGEKLILVGDSNNNFVVLKWEDRSFTIVGRSLEQFRTLSAEFLLNGTKSDLKALVVCGDEEGVLRLWSMDVPSSSTAAGAASALSAPGAAATLAATAAAGRRGAGPEKLDNVLLCKSEFRVGEPVTTLVRRVHVVEDEQLGTVARYQAVLGTASGAIAYVVPLDERVFRRLDLLQAVMCSSPHVPHLAGLNPRAFAGVQATEDQVGGTASRVHRSSLGGVVDGRLVWRFASLDRVAQRKLAHSIGTMPETILDDLSEIEFVCVA